MDEDTFFRLRDKFQLPDETKICLPHLGEKAYSFNLGNVCFYEATFLSGLKCPRPPPPNPFLMELLHHLGIAPG